MQLQAVCPPFRKPKTPLASFHSLLDHSEVSVLRAFPKVRTKDEKKALWLELEEQIEVEQFDIGVIASFGHMIPDSVIDSFSTKNMLVMHPSLLPKYRGSCPIQHSLINGESETGVSIIGISKGVFDAGPLLWQDKSEIREDDTFESMSKKLAEMGGRGLHQVLSDYTSHCERGVPQD